MTDKIALGKLIDFSLESPDSSKDEHVDRSMARTQPTLHDTDAMSIQHPTLNSSDKRVSIREPTESLDLAGTDDDLIAGQICITRIPMFKYGNDMPKGTEVKIKQRVSDKEYVVKNYEHDIHFVVRFNDLTPTTEIVESDYSPSHDSDYEEAYQREQKLRQNLRDKNDKSEIEYPDIEVPRTAGDHAPETDEPAIAPESTPKTTKPAVGTKAPLRNNRKLNEIPVVTKADRRYLRRNSLAIYNRRIAKAKSTLRHLTRNISNITEAMEESQNETIKPRQSIKLTPIKEDVFEIKSNLSLDDIDTENSESDKSDSDNDMHIASGYAPPSTSHFLKSRNSRMDKETESALKYVR